MNPKFMKTRNALLLVSGALLLLVASMILISPAAFYAANGIELGAGPSLVNELKAPAGLLLLAGLLMLGAIVVRPLADTALWLGALIYLGYAASRFLSMAVDGLPATGLVQAAGLEAIIGVACLGVAVMRSATAGSLK